MTNMIEDLIFLSAPITACALMAGILSYFGNHILSRGIIFIDIAIAQVAALGTMIGLLMGYAEGSFSAQMISLVFTLVIVAAFSLTKFSKQIIPQEVIIGIIYCIALGVALLLAEKVPGSGSFITKSISGNILWVTWRQVLTCFVMFGIILVIHLFFWKRFIRISNFPNRLQYSIGRVRLYDLIFYITFGIVISRAVPIGGIFLVFTLLIAPTATATLFTKKWGKRILWSWIIGIAGSIIGIYMSFILNISNGPAIVCLLGICLFILAFVRLLGKPVR